MSKWHWIVIAVVIVAAVMYWKMRKRGNGAPVNVPGAAVGGTSGADGTGVQ